MVNKTLRPSVVRAAQSAPTAQAAYELTPAQRAKLVSKRKAACEATHPETKTGGVPGKAGGGKVAAPKGAKFASFLEDTAAKSGKSTTSVKLDTTRAKRLGADLDRIAGTSLDKGAELDALAAMPSRKGRQLSAGPPGEEVSAHNWMRP
jgi:hypothetical protein